MILWLQHWADANPALFFLLMLPFVACLVVLVFAVIIRAIDSM